MSQNEALKPILMSQNVALKNFNVSKRSIRFFNVAKRSIKIFLMSQNVAGDCQHVALKS